MSDTETLKTTPKPGLAEMVLTALLATAFYLLFALRGNGSHAVTEGQSLLQWIDWQWIPSNKDFSHGWFMLVAVLGFSDWRLKTKLESRLPWFTRTAVFGALVTLQFLMIEKIGYGKLAELRTVLWMLFFGTFLHQSWLHSQTVKKAPRARWLGVLFMFGCMFWHWAMYFAQQPRMSLMGLAGAMWAASFALYGWETAKFMLFPTCYMLVCFLAWLMMPITMKLRLMASVFAEGIINGIGIPVLRQGTMITIGTSSGPKAVNVADACSGLRSLSMMTAIAAPYAYFTQKTLIKGGILFALSIPLAMIANGLRVVILSVCAAWFSEKWFQLAHDYSGFIVFILSLMLLFSAANALNLDYREKYRKWKRNLIDSSRSASD